MIPLTSTPEELEYEGRLVPGMANWKDTGPADAICRTCVFLVKGKRKGASRCDKFRQMTGRVGADLPSDALPACRYHQPKQ